MRNLLPVIAICCTFCACSSQLGGESDLAFASGGPALHAIQDRELRDLMDRMNGLMMERFMTEHEIDIERSRFTQQIIDAAKTLSSTVKHLVSKLPSLELNANQQSAFRNLANKLGQQADTLQKQAENQHFNAISSTLHEMRSTCMACHTLFRKI